MASESPCCSYMFLSPSEVAHNLPGPLSCPSLPVRRSLELDDHQGPRGVSVHFGVFQQCRGRSLWHYPLLTDAIAPVRRHIGITSPDSPYEWYRPKNEGLSGHVTVREQANFRIGEIEMNCWQYEGIYRHFGNPRVNDAPLALCEVLCSTTPNGRNFNLHASFIGRKEDAVIFYQVLRSARTD